MAGQGLEGGGLFGAHLARPATEGADS